MSRAFWEARIARWDRSRYGLATAVARRSQLAAASLGGWCAGRVVAELGCGGGRLLEQLASFECAGLIGVDFSATALQLAARRCPQARLVRADVTCDPLPEADLYVALGLLDWLSAAEIRGLFQSLREKPFLLSFSEARPSLWRLLHWLFVRLSTRPGQPRPAYHRAAWLQELAADAGCGATRVVRHPGLHFGAFLCHAL